MSYRWERVVHLVDSAVDFVYPPLCLACDTEIRERRKKICERCWSLIPPVTPAGSLYRETRAAVLAGGTIDELLSCYIFETETPIQQIIHALKYRQYRSLGIELGKRIGAAAHAWKIEADILVPVPLHRIKLRERGYNPSALIAEGISAVTGLPIYPGAVRRTRHTKTQTHLHREERQRNVEDAFEARDEYRKDFRGKRCMLVDDIITTGATIRSCAGAVRSLGVSSIVAVSAALAR